MNINPIMTLAAVLVAVVLSGCSDGGEGYPSLERIMGSDLLLSHKVLMDWALAADTHGAAAVDKPRDMKSTLLQKLRSLLPQGEG